jgi:hypothetical protein
MSTPTPKELQEPVGEVRITDPYVVSLITDEQNRTGEKSSARTAGRLISERLAIREVKRESEPEPASA